MSSMTSEEEEFNDYKRFKRSMGAFEDAECVFEMPYFTQNNPVINEDD